MKALSQTRALVIGGGAAGISAARALVDAGLEITVVEAGPQLGGNCFQVEVDGERIDAGVSDFNRSTFVHFAAMLDDLGVPTAPIGEAASVVDASGALLWSSRSGSIELAPAAGLGRAEARRFVDEIARFAREAPEVLAAGAPVTMGDYLDRRGYGAAFAELYLGPRAAGAFPMPEAHPRDFDMGSLVAFLSMHGLVGWRPRRRERVVGGMGAYVEAFARWLEARGGQVLTQTRVVDLERRAGSVRVTCARRGRVEVIDADRVVVATSPDVAAQILADADGDELRVLRSHPIQPARLVVHRDVQLMPADRRAWGAFNYVASPGPRPPSITFYPRLLACGGPDDVFVSLNPVIEPRRGRVLVDTVVRHPLARPGARRASGLSALQGRRRAYFCGSYYAAPWLHEQAVASGVEAAWHLLADVMGDAASPASADQVAAAG